MILIMKKLQWFRPRHLFKINPKADHITLLHCKTGGGNNLQIYVHTVTLKAFISLLHYEL